MRACLLAWIVTSLMFGPVLGETLAPANKGREGDLYGLSDRGRARQRQLVILTSEQCPWSSRWLTKLAALQRRDPKLTVIRLEIDRPGSDRIDWTSPLARQYEIRSLPHFFLVEPGQAPVGGEPARAFALDLLREFHLFP